MDPQNRPQQVFGLAQTYTLQVHDVYCSLYKVPFLLVFVHEHHASLRTGVPSVMINDIR